MNTALLALTLLAAGGPTVETSATPTTRLYVRTQPAGAEIKLDGQARGPSDQLFMVPPGVKKMTVEVTLDGFGKEQKTVEIQGGRITRVEFELEESPAAESQVQQMPQLPPPLATADAIVVDRMVWYLRGYAEHIEMAIREADEDSIRFSPWTMIRQKSIQLHLQEVNRLLDEMDAPIRSSDHDAHRWLTAERKAAVEGSDRHAHLRQLESFIYLDHFVADLEQDFEAARIIETLPDVPASRPEPAVKLQLRPRRFVRLVIGEGRMTLQGHETNMNDLPRLLSAVPHPEETVLELAFDPYTASEISPGELDRIVTFLSMQVKQHGLEYLSQIGKHPLTSLGTLPQTLAVTWQCPDHDDGKHIAAPGKCPECAKPMEERLVEFQAIRGNPLPELSGDAWPTNRPSKFPPLDKDQLYLRGVSVISMPSGAYVEFRDLEQGRSVHVRVNGTLDVEGLDVCVERIGWLQAILLIDDELIAVAVTSGESIGEALRRGPIEPVLVPLKLLKEALHFYSSFTGSYPTTQQGLESLLTKPRGMKDPDAWNGPYIREAAVPSDFWGSVIQYEFDADRDTFRLWSMGPDKKSGTADDIALHELPQSSYRQPASPPSTAKADDDESNFADVFLQMLTIYEKRLDRLQRYETHIRELLDQASKASGEESSYSAACLRKVIRLHLGEIDDPIRLAESQMDYFTKSMRYGRENPTKLEVKPSDLAEASLVVDKMNATQAAISSEYERLEQEFQALPPIESLPGDVEPEIRLRRFARICVGPQGITFDGAKTRIEELPDLLTLMSLMPRSETVIELASDSDKEEQTDPDEPDVVRNLVTYYVDKQGYEYLSDIGNQPYGSMGSLPQALVAVWECPDHGKLIATQRDRKCPECGKKTEWHWEELKADQETPSDPPSMRGALLPRGGEGGRRPDEGGQNR